MNDKGNYLPLQEPTFYILLSLHGGEKHGYAILKDVATLSDNHLRLSTGTLYGALYRLLDRGLIEQVEADSGGRGKRAYRLTHSGLEVFDAEVSRMQHMLVTANNRINSAGGQQI
jgi:DNA-binding PadR family transcriptional regulator